MCRHWKPLWPLDSDDLPPRTQPSEVNYVKLAELRHGSDVIPFGTFSGVVYEQLAARAERMAKLFLSEERQRLGREPPAWRYALSQDLKDRVLKTIADDFLEASVTGMATGGGTMGPEVIPRATSTASPGLGLGPVALPTPSMNGPNRGTFDKMDATARLECKHLQLLQERSSGRTLMGYLLRVPFADGMFAQADGTVGPLEVC
jgi:hypothetical protein